MTAALRTRPAVPADHDAILALYPAVFPDEDLVPLVRALLPHDAVRSFVFEGEEGAVAGHGASSVCGLEGAPGSCVLLGPVAVHPTFQRQGIGRALIKRVIEAARDDGHGAVLVLGDPDYYGRFGFAPERQVTTPYPLRPDWAEAWQSVWVGADRPAGPTPLIVPPPWQDPELWA